MVWACFTESQLPAWFYRPVLSRSCCKHGTDAMERLGAQAFELWAVPGGGDPLVRVLYNKEELPLDGLPPGELHIALVNTYHIKMASKLRSFAALRCSLCTYECHGK